MKKVIKDTIFEFDLVYHFYMKEQKLKKEKSILLIYMIKLNILFT